MFLTKDFQLINQNQYKIIRKSEYDIEMMSIKTNHYWLIRSTQKYLLLFHKYNKEHKYHRQVINNFTRISFVLKYISRHDKYIVSLSN